ncbi:sigma-54 dependent transcriptional regulator [sulfur-oxidizing endosymbiont of Gigantopelta aegis]|uniref:sigma-54-dependent transcriptional regulator n=1 Tax=sulfur-oxidizing endosymbiont of Gigantopelta aegis TaxID=2794934 RepID=UPI0031B61903
MNTAESVEDAIILIKDKAFDLILSDLRLPGEPGTSLIKQFTNIPIIIMTSYASVSSAVDAMKIGAIDYISKPFDHSELLLMIKRILHERHLSLENSALKKEIAKTHTVSGMIGDCPAMQKINQQIHKVAPMDTSILILGETGTGKELVARAIHQYSLREASALISINCAAIANNLIESELFGYSKGAFTGAHQDHPGLIEAANGGTLFLDEIGELSLDVQARLLRVLQESEVRRVGSTQTRHVDIRLIAATHRNLPQMVEDKLFRSDLFFRLNVFDIKLPPLKDRGSDINKLANHILFETANKQARTKVKFSSQVLESFQQYNWPGNIREMQNIIERALILSDGNELTLEHIALFEKKPIQNTKAHINNSTPSLSLDEYLVHFLNENTRQTETELAKKLGISRKTLWEKRNRLNIPKK